MLRQNQTRFTLSGHFVINLGRQLGSGGKEIGEKLAQQLGIAFYDKELINLASEESGLCREFFEKADEKASQSILGGLFGSRFPFITEGAYPYNSYLSNDSLFKIQSDVIRHLAEKQSCLFVGRCADYILRDHPRCANVFVSASPEARIERLMKLHNISSEDAEELMEKADKKRSSYIIITVSRHWEQQPPKISVFITQCCELTEPLSLSRTLSNKNSIWTKYYTAFSKHRDRNHFQSIIQKP